MEALWSQFENVMAKDAEGATEAHAAEEGEGQHSEEDTVLEEERRTMR